MSKLSDYYQQPGPADFYKPAMMAFDGSGDYFSGTYTSSGNKITVIAEFSRETFADGSVECLFLFEGPTSRMRAALYAFSTNYSDTDRQGKFQVQTKNSAGTNICLLVSLAGYLDGEKHSLFYEFDGDTGEAVFRIDGVDADDTGNADRVAPTTGTLDSGASSTVKVGSDGTNDFTGNIGFFGYHDIDGTNPQDFMDSSGNPIKQDEDTWANSGFGAQPLFWNEHGEMDNNKGSAGNMTRNGTIVVADAD